MKATNSRILVFDVETSPITTYTWGLYDQNIGLNQIKEDWFFLAWSAKWLGDPASKIIYRDNRKSKDISNDKSLVQELAALIEQADGIITQNGNSFDVKKLNARAIINKLPPIKVCRSTDILREGKKVFKFTSHKLAYTTDILNTKYKKLDHKEYPGFELWKAILSGDKKAWDEMKKYCSHDVLATEEQYLKMRDWIKDPAVYGKDKCRRCRTTRFRSEGTRTTSSGTYRRLVCRACGLPNKGEIK